MAGHVFEVCQDHHIARPLASYAAIGVASQIAHGALHALEPVPDVNLKERAERALTAAEAYSPHVRAPFRFVELGQPT